MKYNVESIKDISFFGDIATMFRTVFAVFGKEYSEEEQKSRVLKRSEEHDTCCNGERL